MENNKKELKNLIENLIELNDNYKYYLTELNNIKLKKNEIESKINNLLDELNLNNKIFVLNENKIQQKKCIQYQSLSLKYIEDCLNNYLQNNNNIIDSKEIINLIKFNRLKKIKNEIKIT